MQQTHFELMVFLSFSILFSSDPPKIAKIKWHNSQVLDQFPIGNYPDRVWSQSSKQVHTVSYKPNQNMPNRIGPIIWTHVSKHNVALYHVKRNRIGLIIDSIIVALHQVNGIGPIIWTHVSNDSINVAFHQVKGNRIGPIRWTHVSNVNIKSQKSNI